MKRSDVRHLSMRPNSLNCCRRRQRTHIYQMTKSMLDVLSWWPKSWRMRSRRTLSNAQIQRTIWWWRCEIQVNLLSYLKQQRQNESNRQSILTRWWKIILYHKKCRYERNYLMMYLMFAVWIVSHRNHIRNHICHHAVHESEFGNDLIKTGRSTVSNCAFLFFLTFTAYHIIPLSIRKVKKVYIFLTFLLQLNIINV